MMGEALPLGKDENQRNAHISLELKQKETKKLARKFTHRRDERVS